MAAAPFAFAAGASSHTAFVVGSAKETAAIARIARNQARFDVRLMAQLRDGVTYDRDAGARVSPNDGGSLPNLALKRALIGLVRSSSKNREGEAPAELVAPRKRLSRASPSRAADSSV